MLRALSLLRASLSIWYYELFVFIGVNLVWLLLSILILPLGPATGGLFYVASQAAKEEPVTFGLFWVGFKRYLTKGWQVMLVILVVSFLMIVNVNFYLASPSSIMNVIGIIWIYVVVFWTLLLIFPFPLLMEMETPKITTLFRNAALLVLDNLGFSISMFICILLVVGLSIFPLGLLPVPFGLFTLLAIFQCKGLLMLMEKYKGRTRDLSNQQSR